MLDIILIGLVLGGIFGGVFVINKALKVYMIKNNRRKERKFRKAVNRIDVMDRVKSGEINLKRK